jgi:chromosome segregation ATPase
VYRMREQADHMVHCLPSAINPTMGPILSTSQRTRFHICQRVSPSSSTATAAKSRARGKSTTTPKQPKKAAAKPRGKSANSLRAQLLELESEVESLRAQNATLLTQRPELDSMRMRVSAADHLRAALEARVASLIQETTDLRRERDVALAEKEGSEKRLKEIEDDRLGKEVLWIRQIKSEARNGKRIQEQLESAEKRVNHLQEILTHHKNKVRIRPPPPLLLRHNAY